MYAGTWEEETEVAIKVFKPEAINQDYVKHCLDKLRSSERHPGILHVHDHDLDGDPAYCVMDLCLDYGQEPPEPQTLESICGQIGSDVAWRLIGQLADAMAHMHVLGIVHCGLKTSNVFITGSQQNPRLQVSDIGQGWLGGVGRLALNDHTFYASPEQLAQPEKLFEAEVQNWDVYAFGVVAYRLLTGYFPRFEEELDALREQIEKNRACPSSSTRTSTLPQRKITLRFSGRTLPPTTSKPNEGKSSSGALHYPPPIATRMPGL